MRSINIQQAGVVDAILSTHARGYKNPDYIAYKLAPVVDVPSRSSRVIKFGKEDFRRIPNTRRAPGTPIVTAQYGYGSDPISLQQDAVQALVPIETLEESNTVPRVDIASRSVSKAFNSLDLGNEIDTAQLLRNPSTYGSNNKMTLSGTSKWSDFGATSDPEKDIDLAKEAIRRMIGQRPNTLVLGPSVFSFLKKHPKIKDQFKWTSGNSVTKDMLAQYFSLDAVIVGDAVHLPDGALDDAAASDIWGNDAILAYVPKGDQFDAPAFAYTYVLKGYPQVEAPHYDKDIRSWKYPIVVERRPYVVGADAGFLIQGAA